MTIQSDVALYFARQFRAARAQVQRDAEGYVAVAIAVEQLGAALGAKDGMYEAQKVIVNTLSLSVRTVRSTGRTGTTNRRLHAPQFSCDSTIRASECWPRNCTMYLREGKT